MVGRIQVAVPGANLAETAQPIELTALLQGDNSEQAFADLVRQHAASGISGVIPKFLDAETQDGEQPQHTKTTLLTHKHIVKGSTGKLPYVSLNEHLCMQVANQVLPAAFTEISNDGKALVVHRFDVNENGQPSLGMEDFCSLLGLRPSAKYDTTWERIAKAVRDHVPGEAQVETFRQLSALLFLTYAVRNADCHAKNIALLYTNRNDVRLAPAYDMITTTVYAGYQHNPPGISFSGRKTWSPGKTLSNFIASTFGISVKMQSAIVESISDAISDTAPQVRSAMEAYVEFKEIGARMLFTWNAGVNGLRSQREYSLPPRTPSAVFDGMTDLPELTNPDGSAGRSEGLARRKPKGRL
jgi:serine/threonine-protein kinase HipA